MHCPRCGQENLTGMRFCVGCGRPLVGPQDSATLDSLSPHITQEGEGAAPRQGAPTTPLPPEPQTRAFAPQDFLVLLVEDSVDNRLLISLYLQQSGYRVVSASNGEEALRAADLSQPDLILMDIGLPELDGLAVTRKLREHPTLKHVPVIAVTAFSTEGFRRAAYDAGIDGYLTKPLDFDRLNELMRKLLPGR